MMQKDLFGKKHSTESNLKNRFIFSPFSVLDVTVLDGKVGRWMNRKREWIKLGIQSEIGRGENMLGFSDADKSKDKQDFFKQLKQKQDKLSPGGSPRPACDYSKRQRGDGHGKPLTYRINPSGVKPEGTASSKDSNKIKTKLNGLTFKASGFVADVFIERGGGTSIFDPVLCELMYQWFCTDNGKIFDPFAGGSVRGIVANFMGYDYTGIELSKLQVKANRIQAKKIIPNHPPKWIVGDSRHCRKLAKGEYDFIFSCPPYADLEVYSDDPRDISNMPYKEFLKIYSLIIKRSVSMLKNNRFACFTIGEIRDKKTGFYRNFISDTIQAFLNAGCGYYNEMILVTPIGSLPVRISKQFTSGRKIGKTHQNVLVFYKGNPKEIKNEFAKCNIEKTKIRRKRNDR